MYTILMNIFSNNSTYTIICDYNFYNLANISKKSNIEKYLPNLIFVALLHK